MPASEESMPSLSKFNLPDQARERINSWTQEFVSDRFFLTLLIIWLLLITVPVVAVAASFPNLPNEIPLFYSRLWGKTQLAQKTFLFLPTGGVALLGIGNFGFAISFHPKDRVFSYLLAGGTALLAVLSATTTLNIIWLVR